ncbi:MAG: adenosylcobinamide-GDP ribazoletransferase [Chitinispirillaceae bacterium]
MISPCITAFRMLTIVALPGKDSVPISRALYFFPLTGMLLGLVTYGLLQLAVDVSPQLQFVSTILILILYTILTGAFHLDGLADVADGFGGGKSREHIQSILKDSRLGTFGTIALVSDILLKLSLWFVCLNIGVPVWIAISIMYARIVQALFVMSHNPAFDSGLLSQLLKIDATRAWLMLLVSAVFWGAGALFSVPRSALVGGLVSLGLCFLFGRYCCRRIGGITGDCVGCANEIAEISFLLTVCFIHS